MFSKPLFGPSSYLYFLVSLSLSLWSSLSSGGTFALELVLSSSPRSSPAFSKPIGDFKQLHAVRIHWQTSAKSCSSHAAKFSQMISRCSPSKSPTQLGALLWMHDSHWCPKAAKTFVVPPGIAAGIEFVLLIAAFTESVTWALMLSKMSNVFWFCERILSGAWRTTLSAIHSLGFLSSTLSCWFS